MSLALTFVVALFFGAIELVGAVFIVFLLSMSLAVNHISSRWVKSVLIAVIILGCLALASHLLPGFNNLLVLNEVNKSVQSAPFTMYLNIDKPMILFILLLLFPGVLNITQQPLSPENLGKPFNSPNNKWYLALLIVGMFIIIFSLAKSTSLIQWEPNLPSWWWLFALNNLLITSVVEEVFFRGYIQQKLTAKLNPTIALMFTSVLFGIAHFSGGPYYIMVATIAGLLYGGVYLLTGKLWYAILTHFALNMVHLVLFTYPIVKHS